jgi:hypothetical protein
MKKIIIGYFTGLTLANIYFALKDQKKLNGYRTYR